MYGIDRIDVLVANAAKATLWGKVSALDHQTMRLHYDTNVLGFVQLFQAFWRTLQNAQNPKWVTMGSSAAYLETPSLASYLNETRFIVWDNGLINTLKIETHLLNRNFVVEKNDNYGPTKVAQHWLTKAIHTEEPWLNAFVVDPGVVQTEMAQLATEQFDIEKPYIALEESVNGVFRVIEAATRETASGRLWLYTGIQLP